MVDTSRPRDPAGSAPIVLCCAHGEGARLEGLVTTLRARGHVVELLEGVELEPRALAAVLDNWRGGGLYVLCRGGAFDRDKIDAVREVLLAHRVPFGRTLTLPASDPDDLLERVDQSLRRMVAHLPAAPRGDAPQAPTAEVAARSRRPTIAITPPAPAPAPPPTEVRRPPPAAAPPAPGRVAPPPPHARPASPPTRDVPPPPPAVAASASAETTIEPSATTDTATTAVEIDAEFVVEDPSIHVRPSVDDELESRVDLDGVLDGIGENTQVAHTPVRTDTQVAEVIPFEGYGDDDVDIADVTQVATLPPVRTTAPTPAPPAPPPGATVLVPAVQEDGPSRGRLLVAAVVASLGLGILAAVLMSSEPSTPTGTDETKPTPSLAAREGKAGDATPGDTKSDAKSGDTKSGDTKPDDTKPDDAKPDQLVGGPAAKPPTTPPAKLDAVATAPRPRTVPKSVEVIAPPRTRVLKALRERSIRALDVLLVTRRATGPMGQQAAVTHCEGLEIAGLPQWRLPEVGELSSLTDAGLLGKGYYWSGTPADTFGDRKMVWSSAKQQASHRPKGSVVICVRGERGD